MEQRAGRPLLNIGRGLAITFAGLAAVVALGYGAMALAWGTDVGEWFRPADLPEFAEPPGAERRSEYVGPLAGGGTSGNGPDGRIIFFVSNRPFGVIQEELAEAFRQRGWKILALRQGFLGAQSPDGKRCIRYHGDALVHAEFQTSIQVFVYPNCDFTPDCRFVESDVRCIEERADAD